MTAVDPTPGRDIVAEVQASRSLTNLLAAVMKDHSDDDLRTAWQGLPQAERDALTLEFYLDGGDPISLEEIIRRTGVRAIPDALDHLRELIVLPDDLAGLSWRERTKLRTAGVYGPREITTPELYSLTEASDWGSPNTVAFNTWMAKVRHDPRTLAALLPADRRDLPRYRTSITEV